MGREGSREGGRKREGEVSGNEREGEERRGEVSGEGERKGREEERRGG